MAFSSFARESARKANGEQADERARALAPILAEIQASRAPSLYAIGAELTRRGIRTAHGNRFWGATQVHNLLKRLDQLAAGGRLPPLTGRLSAPQSAVPGADRKASLQFAGHRPRSPDPVYRVLGSRPD
jgi:hypothetical protein